MKKRGNQSGGGRGEESWCFGVLSRSRSSSRNARLSRQRKRLIQWEQPMAWQQPLLLWARRQQANPFHALPNRGGAARLHLYGISAFISHHSRNSLHSLGHTRTNCACWHQTTQGNFKPSRAKIINTTLILHEPFPIQTRYPIESSYRMFPPWWSLRRCGDRLGWKKKKDAQRSHSHHALLTHLVIYYHNNNIVIIYLFIYPFPWFL